MSSTGRALLPVAEGNVDATGSPDRMTALRSRPPAFARLSTLSARRRACSPSRSVAPPLKVVPLDEGRSTSRLGWSTVVVRALLWVLPGALSLRILTVADVLLPLWHPKRQTLHDLAARTQVVRTRQGG